MSRVFFSVALAEVGLELLSVHAVVVAHGEEADDGVVGGRQEECGQVVVIPLLTLEPGVRGSTGEGELRLVCVLCTAAFLPTHVLR